MQYTYTYTVYLRTICIKMEHKNRVYLVPYAYAFTWLRYGILLWGQTNNAKDFFIFKKRVFALFIMFNPEIAANQFL